MKRFIIVTVLAAVLVTVLASAAFAAGPVGGRWASQTSPQQAVPTTGACPMGGAGMMGRPGWAGQPDEVAALLGMTAGQIQAERQSGKSLAQIAQAKGVSEDKLIETILAAKKAILQDAVTAGKLTQAQVEAMLDRMDDMVKVMVERTTTGPMMGGRGGMMGGRGGMRGQGMFGQGLGQTF